MEEITSRVPMRNDLKKFLCRPVKAKAEVVCKVYERALYDGRNYNSYEIEKRIVLTNVEITDGVDTKVLDHMWISQSQMNSKEDFQKLMEIIKTSSKVNISFDATINMYIKNLGYNEDTKKMHHNKDYGFRNILNVDIDYEDYVEETIEEPKKEKKELYVAADGSTYINGVLYSKSFIPRNAKKYREEMRETVCATLTEQINALISSQKSSKNKKLGIKNIRKKFKSLKKTYKWKETMPEVIELTNLIDKTAKQLGI